MGVYLAIDQGNTRTKAGIFRNDRLVRKLVMDSNDFRPIQALLNRYRFDGIIFSSVTKPRKSHIDALRKASRLIIFGPDTPVPVNNRYKTPATLGSDRLAAAIGGASLFPGKNVLVIDAGTCIKYDFVDKGGKYLGGSICPGLSMRLQILHEATERLPLMTPADQRTFIGNDTRTSMLTGTVVAAALEAEGFVRSYRKKFGSLRLVITGGDAKRLARHLNLSIFAAPDLVLIGLNSVLRHVLSKN